MSSVWAPIGRKKSHKESDSKDVKLQQDFEDGKRKREIEQINGENIYQDRLNFFDKLALKSWLKQTTKKD